MMMTTMKALLTQAHPSINFQPKSI